MENKNMTLEEEIRDLIFQKVHIDYMNKDEVDFEAPIFNAFDTDGIGLGLDSVDALELVVALRNSYGLVVSDGGIEVLKNINTIADNIRKMDSAVAD